MRKKKEIKRVVEEDQIGWTDPNPDSYGFENTINELKLNGYQAEKENGVLMVTVPIPDKEGFEKHLWCLTGQKYEKNLLA